MSVKLKFRASAQADKEGSLFFQVIVGRVVRQVSANCHIFAKEWNSRQEIIEVPADATAERKAQILQISEQQQWILERLQSIEHWQQTQGTCTAESIVRQYQMESGSRISVFAFIHHHIRRLQQLNRPASCEKYQTTLNSLINFRQNQDLDFCDFNHYLMEDYEAYQKNRGLVRNTTSFYLRILRRIYNLAVKQGLAMPTHPFDNVYMGIDKTHKRAITLSEIKRIKQLDLSDSPKLNFARNIFMLSFYLRGMSFIDMAYLRKKDVNHNEVTYARKKTGQQLTIRIEKDIKALLSSFSQNPTQYQLPLIMVEDGTERLQYCTRMTSINRNLKKIGQMLKLPIPLTLYVSRHSWSSIARQKNVPIAVISEALGHDSEVTTQIYLSSIQTSEVDKANRMILKEL